MTLPKWLKRIAQKIAYNEPISAEDLLKDFNVNLTSPLIPEKSSHWININVYHHYDTIEQSVPEQYPIRVPVEAPKRTQRTK